MARIVLLILTLSMALASTNYAALANTGKVEEGEESLAIGEDHELSSRLRGGLSRLLGQSNPRASSTTCDKFPRVCRAKGSPGPDCCKKQCVNVLTDNLNCGLCGMRCRYGEVCCGGRCVNVMFDAKNCGSCKNRCKKGNLCKYGMCSYA